MRSTALERLEALCVVVIFAALAVALLGCPTDPEPGWECRLDADDPDFGEEIGCAADFRKLASAPLEASIPGARAAKTVVDRVDGDALYFQNSRKYAIHHEFASAHLSGGDLPIVPQPAQFNATEYFSPDRRFILGSLTHYEEPDIWAWELSPYDTASAEMITTAFRAIAEASFLGEKLKFHPTSEPITRVARDLPDDVPVVTTDEIFAGITYQPLNPATSMGRLRFQEADALEDAPPWFREILVLDRVPNDLAVVMGIITAEFQTPLSHINVLSRNRGTPNMGLRGAFTDDDLRALDGKWVALEVDGLQWSIREVTQEAADAWWEGFRPDPIDVRMMDTSITRFTPAGELVDLETHGDLRDAISAPVPAFGGKATHFGALTLAPDVPHPDAFAIPVHWYDAHMEAHGLWDEVDTMLDDPAFRDDPTARAQRLKELRRSIKEAPIDPDFLADVLAYLAEHHPDTRMRFRSSTNAEDVEGFNGAGLYTSKSGDPNDAEKPVDVAIKKVWASVWRTRAFEERSYYGIEHRNIGMALLVHRSFPSEDANGVAVTGNIFDRSGVNPAFYVNVQAGGESVVLPEPGVTTDQLLYYWSQNGRPSVYLGRSNQTPEGASVLTPAQVNDLGAALESLHTYFQTAYGDGGWFAMDVEFKIDSTATGAPELVIKQARPYPE